LRINNRTLVIFAAALCQTYPVTAQDPGAVIRDSAGIHIVENVTPLWTAASARHLSSTPTLSLGTADGAPEEQFGKLQSAVRLSDGSIVVADRKNSELRLFNPDGKFVRRIGQGGEGPGDFRGLWTIFQRPADTILVWDIYLHRLTWFTADGKVRRTLAVEHPASVLDPHGGRATSNVFVAGPLEGSGALGSHGTIRFNPPTGYTADTLFAVQVSPSGKLAPLARLPREVFYSYAPGGKGYSTSGIQPLTAEASLAAGGHSLFYTDGVRYEIREYALDGKVMRIIRVRRAAMPVTDKDIAAFRARDLEEARQSTIHGKATPNTRHELVDFEQAMLNWISFPKTLPAFTALKLEPNGRVWVREYGDTAQVQHWDSFDRSGRLLGAVDFPAGIEVLEVGADYVLGRFRDQDDVESVRLYRFTR
jgi:hypothetical protein